MRNLDICLRYTTKLDETGTGKLSNANVNFVDVVTTAKHSYAKESPNGLGVIRLS